MASKLAHVPGNNNASVVSAAPSAAAASNPKSVAKSPSLFNTLTGTYRAAIGKPPVDPTREVVKSILRIFASGEWDKLNEIKVVVATTLAKTRGDTNPKVVIYNTILDTFNDLGGLVKDVNDRVIPSTIEEIDKLIESFRASKRVAAGSIRGLKSATKVLAASNIKVAGLIGEAEKGVASFFEQKDAQLKAAKSFIRKEERAATVAKSIADAKSIAAARAKELQNAHDYELSNAGMAKLMKESQAQQPITEKEVANTMEELHKMTNANWARIKAAQGKPGGRRKSRRNRSNKFRRNATRR